MKRIILILMIMAGLCASAQEKLRPEIFYNSEKLTIGTTQSINGKFPIGINGYKGLRWDYNGCILTMDAMSDGLHIWTNYPSVDFYDTLTDNYITIRCRNFYVISDGGIKEDITPVANSMQLLDGITAPCNNIQKKAPSAKDGNSDNDALLELIRNEFPDLVETGRNGETLVNYVELVPVLVNALQELQIQANAQRERIAKLKLNL